MRKEVNQQYAGFFIDADDLHTLDELAESQDRSRSAVIRRLIHEEIKRVGKSIRGSFGDRQKYKRPTAESGPESKSTMKHFSIRHARMRRRTASQQFLQKIAQLPDHKAAKFASTVITLYFPLASKGGKKEFVSGGGQDG